MADKTDYQLKQILKYNRDGSPDRQTTRFRHLRQVINHLQEERGYSTRYDLHRLTKKDVNRLVHDWKHQGIGHRSIANRLTELRWLFSKIGKGDQLPRANRDFGLPKREPLGNQAIPLDHEALQRLEEREQLVTLLRVEFGLRTKEAVKFQHAYATQKENQVTLKANWCKGGRARTIPITHDRQRDLLDRVGKFQARQGERSMIPKEQTLKRYYRYYNQCRQAVKVEGHAYRHQWAQDRFKQLSGLDSPYAEGKPYTQLSPTEQRHWDNAAAVVNQELGHGKGRQDITATYIGSRQ